MRLEMTLFSATIFSLSEYPCIDLVADTGVGTLNQLLEKPLQFGIRMVIKESLVSHPNYPRLPPPSS